MARCLRNSDSHPRALGQQFELHLRAAAGPQYSSGFESSGSVQEHVLHHLRSLVQRGMLAGWTRWTRLLRGLKYSRTSPLGRRFLAHKVRFCTAVSSSRCMCCRREGITKTLKLEPLYVLRSMWRSSFPPDFVCGEVIATPSSPRRTPVGCRTDGAARCCQVHLRQSESSYHIST